MAFRHILPTFARAHPTTWIQVGCVFGFDVWKGIYLHTIPHTHTLTNTECCRNTINSLNHMLWKMVWRWNVQRNVLNVRTHLFVDDNGYVAGHPLHYHQIYIAKIILCPLLVRFVHFHSVYYFVTITGTWIQTPQYFQRSDIHTWYTLTIRSPSSVCEDKKNKIFSRVTKYVFWNVRFHTCIIIQHRSQWISSNGKENICKV